MQDIGYYMEDYRTQVGTCAARFSWRSEVGHVGTRGGKIYTAPMVLCAAVLASLLIIEGVELNPGLVDNIVQVWCSGGDRNLKSGTLSEPCGRLAGGNIQAVGMLSFKLRRVENGTATDGDRRDSEFWKRN